MKNLIVISTMLVGLFGIVRAEETTEVTAPAVTVSGEISTDLTFGDENTSTAPYMGLVFSGDSWVISTNLANGNVAVALLGNTIARQKDDVRGWDGIDDGGVD